MGDKSGRNEGVTIIADVRCSAAAPGAPAPAASVSTNEGVRIIADFRDRAQPISNCGPVDTVLPVTLNPETFGTGALFETGQTPAAPAGGRSHPGTPAQQLDGIILQLEAVLNHVKSLRDRAG